MKSGGRKLRVVFACAAMLLLPLKSPASGPSADALSLPCNGCHGTDGVSSGISIPSIAGQDAEFMTRAMLEYRDGTRSATIMNRIAKGYKEYELRKIAGYFSRKPWQSIKGPQAPGLLERGRRLHREHCAECHEDTGRYQDQDVPRIAGQRLRYLYMQMLLYRDAGENLPQPTEMAERMVLIDDVGMKALAHLYANTD